MAMLRLRGNDSVIAFIIASRAKARRSRFSAEETGFRCKAVTSLEDRQQEEHDAVAAANSLFRVFSHQDARPTKFLAKNEVLERRKADDK